MLNSVQKYIQYISTVRRYSVRTREIYSDVLNTFSEFVKGEPSEYMSSTFIRSYEVYLLDKKKLDPRSVNLHLSVLSGYAKFLVKEGAIKGNPVSTVSRPKMEKRLPNFYRNESMDKYFDSTRQDASLENISLLLPAKDGKMDQTTRELYTRRLARVVMSTFLTTGIRRSELISLKVSSVDFSRRTMSVRGKGDKMREIPLMQELCSEIKAYHKAVEAVFGFFPSQDDPMFLTHTGKELYPVYVDRLVKDALSSSSDVTGKKSPHVLRHTLATGLLNEGTDLNSIKEMLGHSSLAATQVYTHNSIEKLKAVYSSAHPRAKQDDHDQNR